MLKISEHMLWFVILIILTTYRLGCTSTKSLETSKDLYLFIFFFFHVSYLYFRLFTAALKLWKNMLEFYYSTFFFFWTIYASIIRFVDFVSFFLPSKMVKRGCWILFMMFMDRISRHRGWRGMSMGRLEVTSLLYVDDVILMHTVAVIRHTLERLTAKYETSLMKSLRPWFSHGKEGDASFR